MQLYPEDAPFNPWTVGITFSFKKVVKSDKKSQSILRATRYIRIYHEFSYRSVSISIDTTAGEVINTIFRILGITGDPAEFVLCMIKDKGLITLSEDSCPLKEMEMEGVKKEELMLQRKARESSDNTDQKRVERRQDDKRTHKLAEFFGVAKSEAEVRLIRNAVGSNKNSKSDDNILNIKEVRKKTKNTSVPQLLSDGEPEVVVKAPEEDVQQSITDADGKVETSSKRTGKLANFFGVSNNEQGVDHIRKLLTAPDTTNFRRVIMNLYEII
jgi:hypothetical protein